MAGFGAQYVGDRVTAFSKQAYVATLPAYTVVNARVGIESGPVRVMVFGDNLANQEPLLFQNQLTLSTIPQLQTSTLRPRTVDIRFAYTIL